MDDKKLKVLYGSQTGTAQDVAERIGRDARRRHWEATVMPMDDYLVANLPNERFVILVASTTGQGDEPDNMKKFWRFLLRKTLPPDSLSSTFYAVFGLGDSSYSKYNMVGKRLFRRMAQLGATALMPRGDGDDQHPLGLDATLDPWIDQLWAELQKHAPTDLPPLPADTIAPPKYLITLLPADDTSVQTTPTANSNQPISRINPYNSVMKVNQRLTTTDHFQDVRHIELDLGSAPITYSPGDVAVIVPSNLDKDLDPVIDRLHFRDIIDCHISIAPNPAAGTLTLPVGGWPPVMTVRELLRRIDVFGRPRRYLFELFANWATAEHEKEKMREFCTPQGQDDLYTYCHRPRRTCFEVLSDFESVQVPLSYLIDVFGVIQPRSFSIASSQAMHPTTLHLCVAIVRYKTKNMPIKRRGVCTHWLANAQPGDAVPTWISKGTMNMPKDPSKPMIMVGPGTGAAPFRSFIQENAVRTSAAEATLFFGCRYRSKDFLYGQDWEQQQTERKLNLFAAFSRDQEHKIYVQHLIQQNSKDVWRALQIGAFVYVSGNAKKMPDEVREALANAITQHGGGIDGKQFVEQMIKDNRLQIETWS